MTVMKRRRALYWAGGKAGVGRIIRCGVDAGVALLVIAGYLVGFGAGHYDFNPLNIASATLLLVVWSLGR